MLQRRDRVAPGEVDGKVQSSFGLGQIGACGRTHRAPAGGDEIVRGGDLRSSGKERLLNRCLRPPLLFVRVPDPLERLLKRRSACSRR
jgi:hypothetical protein